MNICLDCGHHFDDGEEGTYIERHGLLFGPMEVHTGCPLCRGAYEKAEECAMCHGSFLEDDLTFGLCEECIESGVTVENTMLYVLNSSIQKDFYITHWTGSLIGKSAVVTPVLMEIVISAWKEYAKRFPDMALDTCKRFVLDDVIGKGDFAEWLAWKKGNHEQSDSSDR